MSTTDYQSQKSRQAQNITPLSPARIQARKRMYRQQKGIVYGGRIAFVVLLLVVWQLGSGVFLDPLFFSSPLTVISRLAGWINDGSLWFNLTITLQETILGLFFGTVSGLLVGFFFGVQPIMAKIFNPIIAALNSIPKIALAPLFIIWFGIDIPMKVILAAVTVFFLIFLNTFTGVRSVDQNLVNAVRLMGGNSRDITFKVIVPSASRYVLTGLRLAIPYALIGAVTAELIASNRGIGYLIYSSSSLFDTAGVFAGLLVLTIIAIVLNALVDLLERRTSQWEVEMNMSGKTNS